MSLEENFKLNANENGMELRGGKTDGIHLLKPPLLQKYQERFKNFQIEFSNACGYIEDRDPAMLQLNLRDAMTYEVA